MMSAVGVGVASSAVGVGVALEALAVAGEAFGRFAIRATAPIRTRRPRSTANGRTRRRAGRSPDRGPGSPATELAARGVGGTGLPCAAFQKSKPQVAQKRRLPCRWAPQLGQKPPVK